MLPLITFLYVTLSFLITSDNLLLILAVKSTRSLQKAANFSLVSLAVADLFVGVIVLPLRIVEVQAFSWSRSIFWCQCSLSLTLFSLSATMLNLLILTIERYCAIIVPLFYQSKFSSRRIFYAIVVGWIVAVMVSFLPFVGLKNKTAQERSKQHRICRFADTMSAEYLSFFSAVVVLFPTLFISYAYVKIFLAASKLRRRLKSLQIPREGEEIVSALKESKTAKNIGIVVGMFYLCWIPFMVAVILSAFYKNLVTPVVVLVISTLVYSNSAMNPILYGYLNREFRLAYKRLLPKVSWPCKWMVHVHQGRLRSYDLSTFSVGDVTGHSQVHVGEGTVPCDSAF